MVYIKCDRCCFSDKSDLQDSFAILVVNKLIGNIDAILAFYESF